VIEKLVPAEVASDESFTDVPESLMLPAEAAQVAKAVEKRRREFGTVRHLARTALAELGMDPVALLPGAQREPLWPAGVVGSLTHCAGYRAAVVARVADVHSVGIDAEPHAPLPEGVLEAITVPDELPRLAALCAADPSVHWDRMLFSAKEAVYKTWFPLAGCWLGFEDASITLAPGGVFRAELLVAGPTVAGVELRGFSGRWLVESGLVLTAICLPVQPSSR
jgi:4'-phosphopantetheinyl transferase EntD